MRKKINPMFLLVGIILVVSQACDLPFGLSSGEESAPAAISPTGTVVSMVSQPTPMAIPTEVPPEPLPPAIVETAPLPGSTISLNDGITLYFNQSMDRDSVETAIQIDPQTGINLEWLDEETLFIKPEQPLPVSSEFALSIDVSARSSSGLSLIEPFSLTYPTAKGLQVVERLPRPDGRDVNPGAALAVTFNNPVVPLSGESIEHAPAFTLEPAAAGHGEWLNTSTFIFYPDPPLFGGTEYSLKLNLNLVSTSGAPLIFEADSPSEWKFRTALPMLLSIEPQEAVNLPLDSSFSLFFNQPMDRESVEENLSLQDDIGNTVSGEFSWNEDSSELTFQPDDLLSRETIYQMNLSRQTLALGGTPLGEDHSFVFVSVGSLEIQETLPSLTELLDPHSGFTSIRIRFNAPLAEQDLSGLVSVEPPLGDVSIFTVNDQSIMISGYFSASTEYTLTISRDIMDRWQGTLGEPYIVPFSTTAASPSLTIPMVQMGSSTLFLTPDDISIPANVTNLGSIDVESYKLSLTEFIELSDSINLMSDFVNPDVSYWRQSLVLSKNVYEQVDLRVTSGGESLETGLYLFRMDSNQLNSTAKKFLLVVSHVHLVIKRSADELFIWAVDLETNKPIADKVLTIYHTSDVMLSNCMTDASGTCRIDLPESLKTYDSIYVLTGDPGTSSFGFAEDNWSAGISGWDFGFYTHITRENLKGYMYTDRPIYRPGQTVNFRAIVRHSDNGRYTIPDMDQVVVEVIGTYSMETGESPTLAEITIPLSDYGAGSASYTLPEDAPPGYYTMRIQEIEDTWLDFQVAEYRKPEIDLQVSFSSQDYLMGQDLQATVQADYYFGVPAGELDVHWALYTRSDYIYLPYGYQVGARSLDWFDRGYWMPVFNTLGNYVLEGNGKTNLDGSIVIDLPYDDLADEVDVQNIQQLTLEVTIR
ncbi:MAG: Ig-like domain-containing protein, partial [Anaerolineaceae bacterium]|nr:Ig-like domain-containing protein [Anaerolineaceae bacterium]